MGLGSWIGEKLGIGGRDFNAGESKKARNFQLMMSNTAHQRETDDMRKAGINPMLSVMGGGGATSASGAAASAPGGGEDSVGSALELRKQNHEVENIDAQAKKTQAEAELTPKIIATDIENTKAATEQAKANTEQARALRDRTNAESTLANIEALAAKSTVEQQMASAKNNATAEERSSKMRTWTSPIKEIISPITEVLHGWQTGSAAMNHNRSHRDPKEITLDTGHKINKKGQVKDPPRRK